MTALGSRKLSEALLGDEKLFHPLYLCVYMYLCIWVFIYVSIYKCMRVRRYVVRRYIFSELEG